MSRRTFTLTDTTDVTVKTKNACPHSPKSWYVNVMS